MGQVRLGKIFFRCFCSAISRRRSLINLCIMIALLQGCALLQRGPEPSAPAPTPTPTPAPGPAPAPSTGLPQVGEASWYGAQHEGKPTATGASFDPKALTAAHKTLPLGSTVKVTNLANGKTVIVTINDRGPFAANRIIDLSEAAAQALGMTKSGKAKVRLESAPTQ